MAKTMKERELDFSYWLTLQNRVLNSGFVTVTTNAETGKQYWHPTPSGIKAYKRNRLFKTKYSDNT